jgi:hypothetical protein
MLTTEYQPHNLKSHKSWPDSIKWNITTDGQYSTALAYRIQFVGRMESPELAKTWKLQAEGKI